MDLAASVKGYRLPEGDTGEVLVNRDVTDIVIRLQPAAGTARR